MRYLKVLLFALIFFVSMVFFFQNQAVLSTEMKLHLNLFFMPPMESISLPFYFLVLAAFLVGAILAVLVLVWDKMNLSARYMKAKWRIHALEKEVNSLKEKQAIKELNAAPSKGGFFGKKDPEPAAEETPIVEVEASEEKKEESKEEKKEEPKQRLTTATPEDFS